MGLCEILTLMFVLLKLVDKISWSWWIVLLPEIIALVVYAMFIIASVVSNYRLRKTIREYRKRSKFYER